MGAALWFAETFVQLLLAIAISIGALLLQVWLSAKKRFWVGLIPLIVLIVAVVGSVSWSAHSMQDETAEKRTWKMENGMTAQMYVRMTGDGEVKAWSDLEIVDQKGTVRDRRGIFLEDEMDGYKPPFMDLFRKMLGDRIAANASYMEKEVIQNMHMLIIAKGSTTLYVDLYKNYLLILYMGVPMLLIYCFKRRQVNRERTHSEMRKMEITNL